ncbi:MAG: peptidyl-prolyl cis-trans isomerase, partial [Deltaproteobacteria bacterium]|nr:peptidyl-prolyl cis-trans isomerase [Deltaproteobacteria bacterium]
VAAGLAPGEIGPPTRYASGTIVVRLVSRDPGRRPPFEEVRDAVRVAWIRDTERDARVALLHGLRADAEIRINEPVRDAPMPQLQQ